MPLAMVAPPSTLALIEEMLWPFLYFYSVNTIIDKAHLIGPSLLATDNAELASSTNTTRLSRVMIRSSRTTPQQCRICAHHGPYPLPISEWTVEWQKTMNKKQQGPRGYFQGSLQKHQRCMAPLMLETNKA